MSSRVYKGCAVPNCDNTTIKTPEKLFVFVPLKTQTRDKWLKLARLDSRTILPHNHLYFCEDHFDLPNDMENYMEYHLMGSVGKVRMKPGCLPRKYECQPDRKKRTCNAPERPYILKKKRRLLIEEYEKDLQERTNATKQLELGETSCESSDFEGVKMKRKSVDMDLYEGHTIKEEAGIVIGPTVVQELCNAKPRGGTWQFCLKDKLFMSIEIPLYRVDKLEFWQRLAKLNTIDLSRVDLTKHILCPKLQAKQPCVTDLKLAWPPPLKYERNDDWKQVAIKMELDIDLPERNEESNDHRISEKTKIDEQDKLAENVLVAQVLDVAPAKLSTDKTNLISTKNRKTKKSEYSFKRKNGCKEWSHYKKATPNKVDSLERNCQMNLVKYVCDTCDKQVTVREVFSSHIKKNNKITYYCDLCNKIFQRKSVIRHILEQHDLTSCDKCHQTLEKKVKDVLEKHICGTCNERFKTENDLHLHVESNHKHSLRQKCNPQTERQDYNNHLNGSNKKMLICDTCNKQFKKKPDVRRHIISMHTEKTLYCKKCPMVFKSKYAYVQHNSQHKSDKTSKSKVYNRLFKYVCDKCNKRYKRKEQIRNHMEIHTRNPYSCEVCSLVFKSKSKLNKHTLQQHDIVSCDKCNQKIKGKDYKYHLTKSHAGIKLKIYICDTCSKQFYCRSHLCRHMKTHTGLTFSCNTCQMAFKTKLTLFQHTSIQHDIFSCVKCNKNLKGKDYLSHLITKHNKKKVALYICDTCNVAFNKRDSLIIHINRHIYTSFYCIQCNKELRSMKSFRNHIRGIHGIKTRKSACDWIKNNLNKINIYLKKINISTNM